MLLTNHEIKNSKSEAHYQQTYQKIFTDYIVKGLVIYKEKALRTNYIKL